MFLQVDGNEGGGHLITVANPSSGVTAVSTPGIVGSVPGRSSPGNTSSGKKMKKFVVKSL